MDTAVKSKVSEIYGKYNFSNEDAKFLSDVLRDIDERQNEKVEAMKEIYLTKDDKIDLTDRISDGKNSLQKSIYIVGLVQYLAMIASMIAIVKFMMN